jgi:hypothetical protein
LVGPDPLVGKVGRPPVTPPGPAPNCPRPNCPAPGGPPPTPPRPRGDPPGRAHRVRPEWPPVTAGPAEGMAPAVGGGRGIEGIGSGTRPTRRPVRPDRATRATLARRSRCHGHRHGHGQIPTASTSRPQPRQPTAATATTRRTTTPPWRPGRRPARPGPAAAVAVVPQGDRPDPHQGTDGRRQSHVVIGMDDSLGVAEDQPRHQQPTAPEHDGRPRPIGPRRRQVRTRTADSTIRAAGISHEICPPMSVWNSRNRPRRAPTRSGPPFRPPRSPTHCPRAARIRCNRR